MFLKIQVKGWVTEYQVFGAGVIVKTMRFSLFLLLIIAVLVGIGFWRYTQPLPVLKAEAVSINQPAAAAVELPWPPNGQAALGAAGYGVLTTHKAERPVPIASIAKTVTALAILRQKPLEPGQNGPTITITEADVQSYRDYLAKDGSIFPVKVGDKITQQQALLAMLVPSANNIADTLARWAFGSLDNYVAYANQLVQSLGMAQTHIADASGFSPQTTSTAKDLIILGEAVLSEPIIASAVRQSEARLPGIDQPVNNVNWLLGTDGIIGIKTGNTDQAKGTFLFAAKRQINGQNVTLIGAVLGAKTRNVAMSDARLLIQAADKGFEIVTVVQANQPVARYNLPWGGSVDAIVSNDLTALNWKGSEITLKVELADLNPQALQNSVVGSVKTNRGDSKSVPVQLRQPISEPPFTWRLLR